LSGATTNQATSVGSTAPKTSAATSSRVPVVRASAAASSTPHTPPQNTVDHSCGTPNGSVGAMP
jgi:hypothetical protein